MRGKIRNPAGVGSRAERTHRSSRSENRLRQPAQADASPIAIARRRTRIPDRRAAVGVARSAACAGRRVPRAMAIAAACSGPAGPAIRAAESGQLESRHVQPARLFLRRLSIGRAGEFRRRTVGGDATNRAAASISPSPRPARRIRSRKRRRPFGMSARLRAASSGRPPATSCGNG